MTSYSFAAGFDAAIDVAAGTAEVFAPSLTALSGGRSALAWTDDQNAGIWLRLFDADGAPEGPAIPVTSTGQEANRPSVAELEGGNIVVTFTALDTATRASRRGQEFAPDGTPVGPQFLVAAAGTTSVSPQTTALSGGGFVTVFDALGVDGDAFAVVAQITKADRTPLGDTFQVNQTTGSFQSAGVTAELDDGGFVVTWRSRDVDGSFYAVMMRSYDADGTARGNEVRVNQYSDRSQTLPDIAVLADGRYVITWQSDGQDGSDDGIYGRIYAANGTAQGGEFRINTTTALDQSQSFVSATPDGGFVVGWYNQLSSDRSDIRLRQFDSTGTAVGGEQIVGTGPAQVNTYPEIIVGDDGLARLTWFSLTQGAGVGSVMFAVAGLTAEGTGDDDVITGQIGDDLLSGLAGDDTLDGGAGDDILDGGAGQDTASYAAALAGVSVYLEYSERDVGAGQGRDSFVSIEGLTGSAFDDRLVGDAEANTLDGGDGDDILKGKGGADVFHGGGGDDRIRGDAEQDTAHGGSGSDILIGLGGDDALNGDDGRDFLYGGRDDDTVFGGAGDDELRGNRGNDTLEGGIGMDDLRGGGNNDTLVGGESGDFLFGENGNDVLDGGTGDDALTGGAGRDSFVFALGFEFVRVIDFEDGSDILDLTDFGFSDFDTEVRDAARDTSFGLRIDFGGGDVLFVESFDTTGFDASDVLL